MDENTRKKFDNLVETEDLIRRIMDLNPGWICSVYDPKTHMVINKWAPAVVVAFAIILGFFLGYAHG